jgi:hypothetical protein
LTRFHPEAFLFALVWAALALAGGFYGGWIVGALLSVGLLVLVSGSSAIILSRYDNFAAERLARWGLLALAALGLLLWLRAAG